jgi:hypothetical protein
MKKRRSLYIAIDSWGFDNRSHALLCYKGERNVQIYTFYVRWALLLSLH